MHLTARRKRGLRREANGFRTPIMALLPKLALRGLLAAPAGPLVGLITPLAGLRTAAKGLTAGMVGSHAGGAVPILGQRGRSDGGPRGAKVLEAVGAYLRGRQASGRGPGRGRSGRGRGVKAAVTAPETAPPAALLPGFSGDSVGCSSPLGTTQGREGARC